MTLIIEFAVGYMLKVLKSKQKITENIKKNIELYEQLMDIMLFNLSHKGY